MAISPRRRSVAMPQKYKTVWLKDGRACIKCLEFKPWDAFYKRDAGPNGHEARCKMCRRSNRIQMMRQFAVCKMCGDWMDASDKSTSMCNGCINKLGWVQGRVYLTVDKTYPFARGGHFSTMEFNETLKNGYWPEGMVVELWSRKNYVCTYEVRGVELVPRRTDKIVGDGVYLKAPAQMANSDFASRSERFI